jgi:hypothetical protein
MACGASRPVKLSDGLVLGVNDDVFEILEFGDGEFHIRMLIKEKISGFVWNLVSIYGAHSKDKERFLVKFAQVLSCNTYPYVLGGDLILFIKLVKAVREGTVLSGLAFLMHLLKK